MDGLTLRLTLGRTKIVKKMIVFSKLGIISILLNSKVIKSDGILFCSNKRAKSKSGKLKSHRQTAIIN